MIAELFLSGIIVWLAGAMASLVLWRHPSAARRVGCGAALGGSLLVLVGSAAAIFSGSSTEISLPFGTELEYADDVTLTRAFEGRQAF